MSDIFDDIDSYLNKITNPDMSTLADKFRERLEALQISATEAFAIMGVQYRTVKGLLDGTQKLVDVRILVNLANFLQLNLDEVIKLYIVALEKHYPSYNILNPEIAFIKDNFDLAALKKSGTISSISDFNHITERLTARLGLTSILEYRKPSVDVAFSSGSFNAEKNLTRGFWISAAFASLAQIKNPYSYNRDALIDIFPSIRKHSTNVEDGLVEVSKALFKIGITVIFQAPLQSLQLRGATFNVNDKPCIVLTDYRGLYPTLWFALIHELYHVLFDWEDIRNNRYHVSDDSNEQDSVIQREMEADNFARTYLFSKEKSEQIRPYINDFDFVKRFAEENHVHPSFIYVFNAFDTTSTDRKPWARARKLSPNVDFCKKPLYYPWDDEEIVTKKIDNLVHATYQFH